MQAWESLRTLYSGKLSIKNAFTVTFSLYYFFLFLKVLMFSSMAVRLRSQPMYVMKENEIYMLPFVRCLTVNKYGC